MAEQVSFRRAAIIGTGLIGGSFALGLRQCFPDMVVAGYDRAETLSRAVERGALHQSTTDLATAVHSADLIYIALPISATLEVLPQIARAAKPSAFVTDACSTKVVICAEAQKYFRDGARFLGGHPMAGKEHPGIENANPGMLRAASYALIGSEDDADSRVCDFVAILHAFGAKPVWCDAGMHDWAVGIVSHLPQLISIALARVVETETDETGMPVVLAGNGLQDMLRLAGSPYSMWRDILLTNKENISRALERLAHAIEHLRAHLVDKDIEQEFQAANDLYKVVRKNP